MAVFLAYLGFSIVTLVVFRLVLCARWRRPAIQELLRREVANCRDLLDLEKALRQAFVESGIPKLLLGVADFLTLLYGVGVVLAWLYLPTWPWALAATLLLPLAFTLLFYHVLEFAGPWWGFPSAYIQRRLESEDLHDWQGCQCRECRVSRNGGHQWDAACRCRVCGEVRHPWNGADCPRCGEQREQPSPSDVFADDRAADSSQVQVPLS